MAQNLADQTQAHPAINALIGIDGKQSMEELIEMITVPPAIHVGLAEAERALHEDSPIQPRILNPDIDRPVPVEAETGLDGQSIENRGHAICPYPGQFLLQRRFRIDQRRRFHALSSTTRAVGE